MFQKKFKLGIPYGPKKTEFLDNYRYFNGLFLT